ncbi:MAG: N-acetyltransferase [Elusimicrobia bacterium]|nr:N-acetyltransferase [Elusimicrobiota bacterium]
MSNMPVRLGRGHAIEPGARVGVRSPRSKGKPVLSVGDGAIIRSGTVVYLGSRIGKNLETGHHAVIREENVIGHQFRLWNNSTIDYSCRIGNRVKVHCNCYVAQFTTLEDEVFLAPGVTIANDLYPGNDQSACVMRGPRLGKGVQVGVNATILPYVRIGAGSIIGAGAVVVRDVPPGSVVVGNPGRVIGKVQAMKRRWLKNLSRRGR